MATYWSTGLLEGYEDHQFATCDGCEEKNFRGERFDCNTCQATFCETCVLQENYGEKSYVHTDFHSCKVTPCPLDRLCASTQEATCSGCLSENFTGDAYKCKECVDYILCRDCHLTGCYAPLTNTPVKHSEDHEMEEIHPPQNDALSWSRMLASAIKFQQMMGPTQVDSINTYHVNDAEEWMALGRKVGFALYNAPTINAEESSTSVFGYTPEQEQRIHELRDHFLELYEKEDEDRAVRIAFLFINYLKPNKFEGTMPLFKVFTKDQVCFVEPYKRTYKGWGDFCDKNRFPACTLLCPKNGSYVVDDDGRVCVEMRPSGDCKTHRQILKTGDKVATGGAVLGTSLALVGLFTPLAPIAAGALAVTGVATGSWFTGRTTANLIDRRRHEQTLNPFADSEVFFSWLSLVGTAVSLGSSMAVARLAELASEGVAIGTGTRLLTNLAIFGALGLNGFGCVTSVVTLVDDLNKGRKPSPLQLFQLSAQLLFFTNAIYSVKQASTIIENATKGELRAVQNELGTKEERSKLKRMLKRNNNKFGRGTGGQVTLKRLKDLQVKKAGDGTKLGPAIQKHAHFDKENLRLNSDPRSMEVQAAAIAETARTTRYGGYQADLRSKTTVMAIEPDALQNKLNDAIQASQRNGRHDVKVPGTFQAWEFRYDPKTGQNEKVYMQVKDPVFGVTNGRADHFNAQKTGAMNEIPQQQFYDAYKPIQQPTPLAHRFYPPRPARRGDDEHEL